MIRSRAHQLWLHEGQPEGRALEHWLTAQREHAANEVAAPWYDRAFAGPEIDWMRRVLWKPQPFVATH
ncbi:hypothetical protein GCM10011390_30240 [Aureimonas endophytica]|uniref:DUF2934 family protein n=1 Tax=Aureimonas endophytica TaxID=2027858 RepID=A0A916ZQC5_9HYPH|nr:hypothetical protein GCM10011390_30240 [Aureimonas endophytica]